MRILLWHGYLLGGTGSNVYTRALAREWSLAGHDVTVVCQERHPEHFDLGGARVVVPELPGGLLPAFVLDRYEGLEARLFGDFTQAEREAYVEANAAALRELAPADSCSRTRPARRSGRCRERDAYRVKAHGSELEYAMRDRPEPVPVGRRDARRRGGRLCRLRAHSRVLEEITGRVEHVEIVRPGSTWRRSGPEPREEALAALLEEAGPIGRTRATPRNGSRTPPTQSASTASSRTSGPRSSTSGS